MLDTKSIPQPGECWLSCPPFVLIAHIVAVERAAEPPLVSYELQDDDGAVLESVEHAVLDEGWWKAFQPMRRRVGWKALRQAWISALASASTGVGDDDACEATVSGTLRSLPFIPSGKSKGLKTKGEVI